MKFKTYSWSVVAFLVLVILWGAVVRATGSGAGCGRHWPLCNGVVVPQEPALATMIELSHRITSSLSGLLVIGLLVWAWRRFGRGSVTRRAAVLTFVFILIEGALGAGLVLLELVENNATSWRAIAVGLHLLNTFILLGWAVLTAWSSHYPEGVRFGSSFTGRLLIGGLAGMALVSAAGAVTALGDTLFLSGELARQMGADAATRHFLVQLRVIHPVLAVALALFLFGTGRVILARDPHPRVRRLALTVMGVVAAQTALGVSAIALRAPIPVQIGHLLLADLLWIALLTLTFEVHARAGERIDLPEAALQPA